MPPRPRNIIPFPARRDNRRITLSDTDHALLTDLISPYYSSEVADLLARAPRPVRTDAPATPTTRTSTTSSPPSPAKSTAT